MNNIYNIVYKVSITLLLFLTSIVSITSVFFLLGIPITIMNTIISTVLAELFLIYIEKNRKNIVIITLCTVLIICICTIYSGQIFDNTWDGAFYHKQAVGILKEGWNPVLFTCSDYNNMTYSIDNPGQSSMIWAEVYPKATWYFGANMYYITNNIETGKSYTLLFAFILFGLVLWYLKDKKMSRIFRLMISLLAGFNPIVCAQFQSYYLDGLATCVIGIIMIEGIILVERRERDNKLDYIVLMCTIIWGCNLKFSILLFVITYIGIIYIILCIIKRDWQIRQFVFFACSGLFAVLIGGFTPYITNILRYGNIFGAFSNWISSVDWGQEIGVGGLNNIERFWLSLFGRMSHGNYHSVKEILKIPFTFAREELEYYFIPDTRVGGFGVFFSGLFSIFLIFLCFCIFKGIRTKKVKEANYLMFIFFIISLIEMMLLPGTNIARYIGQIYFFVLWSFVLMYYILRKKILTYILIGVSLLNILPWVNVGYYRLKESYKTKSVLQELGQLSKDKNMEFDVAFHSFDFNGLQYNLKDFKIKYHHISADDIGDNYHTMYYNLIYYKNTDN